MHKKSWVLKNHTKFELGNYGINICRDCHSAIHRYITEKELAKSYHTKELLMTHPDVCKFVEWVSKQKKKIKK